MKAVLTLNFYPTKSIYTHPHLRWHSITPPTQNPTAISIDIFTVGAIQVNPINYKRKNMSG
jgi:hypothetical protein